MKISILSLIIMLSFIGCKNQNKINTKEIKIMPNTQSSINLEDFMMGKWELQNKMIETESDKNRINFNCKTKPTWEFSRKGNNISQKMTSVDNDCKTIRTTEGVANFTNPNNLLYFVNDIGLYVSINIEDNNNITIIQNEIIGGKQAKIIYYYKRIKK